MANWLAMPIAASSRATDQALLRWRQLLRAQACGADVQQAWGWPGALLPHCGLRKPAPLWCLLLSASWLNPQLDATTVCQLLKRQCDGPMEQVRGRSTEASEGLVRGSSANVSYACSPFLRTCESAIITSQKSLKVVEHIHQPFVTGKAFVRPGGVPQPRNVLIILSLPPVPCPWFCYGNSV